jgi:cytochrome c oxidase accessory protein FixG
MATRRLPLVDQGTGSLASDGRRRFVYPADVKGRFRRIRWVVFSLLVAVWLALPLVPVGGRPALLLDVGRREFYVFGASFNAQDAWLLVFVVTGVGFALALVTSLWGRVFCGYACPQTVFLEGLFRPIERLFEGSREQRLRLARAPWTAAKLARKVGKHVVFVVAALGVAHVTLGLFVSLPSLYRMLGEGPAASPEAFAWAMAITAAIYIDFAWFREQLCLIVCPYGRLQSALTDEETVVIGYDTKRGEPRGKATDPNAGDCVDCKRCVVVCPTAIDIRDGLQLDCIGCSACVDACDEVMTRLGRPTGLVRYDSQRGFEGYPKRVLRPRLAIYAVLGLFGVIATAVGWATRTSFEASLLREKGAPYVVDGDVTRNHFVMHLVNKSSREETFEVAPEGDAFDLKLSEQSIRLAPMGDGRIRVVALRRGATSGNERLRLRVKRESNGEVHVVEARFLTPPGGAR